MDNQTDNLQVESMPKEDVKTNLKKRQKVSLLCIKRPFFRSLLNLIRLINSKNFFKQHFSFLCSEPSSEHRKKNNHLKCRHESSLFIEFEKYKRKFSWI